MSIPSPRLRSDGDHSPGTLSENYPGERIESQAAEGVIPFGRAVVQGSAAGLVKVPAGSADKFRGVAVKSTSSENLNTNEYADGNPVGVANPCVISVELEEAVNENDDVRVRHSEDATSGSQSWGFTAAKTAASVSGLLNDATAYTASVVVDGVAKAISIVGSAAQTLQTVINELNVDLGAAAVASFDAAGNGFIKITSATKGAASSVLITDTNLFATLTNRNAAPEAAIAGTALGDPAKVPGMFRTTAEAGRTWKLTGARYLTGGLAGKTAKVLLNGAIATAADV